MFALRKPETDPKTIQTELNMIYQALHQAFFSSNTPLWMLLLSEQKATFNPIKPAKITDRIPNHTVQKSHH